MCSVLILFALALTRLPVSTVTKHTLMTRGNFWLPSKPQQQVKGPL